MEKGYREIGPMKSNAADAERPREAGPESAGDAAGPAKTEAMEGCA
jgi:hypothetical protein